MSEVKTLKCDGDGCGKLRINDANHWLKGSVDGTQIAVGTMHAELITDSVKDYHFCGAACAQRWFAGELQKLQS